MGIRLIYIGLFFLINPNIATLDILPDFVGFILILVGINKLRDLSSKIEESKKTFFILTFVGALKMLSVALIPVMDASEYTWILIFTMCFASAEAILSILAFSKLIEGFSFLGMVHNGKGAYRNTNIFGMSATFFIIKAVFSITPFFVYLKTDYGYVGTTEVDYSFLMNVFQAFNLIIVLVFGVLWLIIMRRYFISMTQDKAFISSMEKEYHEKIGSRAPLLTYRTLRVFLLLISIAVFFVIDLRFDGIDILPDFISSLLFLSAAIYMMRRYKKHSKIMAAFSSLYIISALAGWVLSAVFTAKYYDFSFELGYASVVGYEVKHNINVFNEYVLICVVEAIKSAFFVLIMFVCTGPIKDMIKNHTGIPSETTTKATIKKETQIKKRLSRLLGLIMILAVLVSVLSVIALAFKFHISDYTDNPDAIMYYTGTISTISSVILFALVTFFSNRLLSSIEYKYIF